MSHAYCCDPGLPRHRDPSHGHHCLTHSPPEVSLKGQQQKSTISHASCGDLGPPPLRDPSHGHHCLTHPPPEVSLKGQ